MAKFWNTTIWYIVEYIIFLHIYFKFIYSLFSILIIILKVEKINLLTLYHKIKQYNNCLHNNYDYYINILVMQADMFMIYVNNCCNSFVLLLNWFLSNKNVILCHHIWITIKVMFASLVRHVLFMASLSHVIKLKNVSVMIHHLGWSKYVLIFNS